MLEELKKYNSIFVNKMFLLGPDQKKLLCLSFIARQRHLVKIADKKYGLDETKHFEEQLGNGYDFVLAASLDVSKVINWISIVEERIPDTEEYRDIEGSFLQNAWISLMYFYQFLISSEDGDFAHSVEKVLESVDIIHFNQDENYDESVIMRNEISILELLIDIIKENNVDEGAVKKVKNRSELFLIKWNF